MISLGVISLGVIIFLSSSYNPSFSLKQQEQEEQTEGPLSDISSKQLEQLSKNGTSFDGFLKHRMTEMRMAGIPLNYSTSETGEQLKFITYCTSPLGKAFIQVLCDFGMAALYELCQAIQSGELYTCLSPAVNSYIKDRNMTDGQTDQLAWAFVLHYKEITQNPYDNNNNNNNMTNSTSSSSMINSSNSK